LYSPKRFIDPPVPAAAAEAAAATHLLYPSILPIGSRAVAAATVIISYFLIFLSSYI